MQTKYLLLAVMLVVGSASAQEVTALSCNDFRPTNEAIERYPNLVGACEGIVERDGELYGLFRAVVRRVVGNNVRLHLPATNKTYTARPDGSLRVLVGDKKLRPRDLARGQEIRIYLAVNAFSKPDIEEVAFISEQDVVVNVAIVEDEEPSAARGSGPAAPAAETREVQVPGKVMTSTVRSVAIVEAINRETREIKLIDPDGERYSIFATDMVRNFDQIEPRDRIVVEYLESVAVFVVPPNAPELGDTAAVEVAPLGGKPGVKAAETFMVRATIEGLNITDRIAFLRTETGEARTVKLSDQVPLDMISIGDEVRLRVTKAMAVSVRKADKS